MIRAFLCAVIVFGTTGVVPIAHADDPAPEVLDEGKRLFLTDSTPACAICHTLKDAGSSGTIGPDLDSLNLDFEAVQKAMVEGTGVMPSFAETLSDSERDAVAQYLIHATSSE